MVFFLNFLFYYYSFSHVLSRVSHSKKTRLTSNDKRTWCLRLFLLFYFFFFLIFVKPQDFIEFFIGLYLVTQWSAVDLNKNFFLSSFLFYFFPSFPTFFTASLLRFIFITSRFWRIQFCNFPPHRRSVFFFFIFISLVKVMHI